MHYRRIKVSRKIDNCLYRHFNKLITLLAVFLSIQPVEKITYDDNSTKRYRNIMRHELELKWINDYKHHIQLVLMIILTLKVTFLDYLILNLFSLLDIRKRNKRSHGKTNFNFFRIKYHLIPFRPSYGPFTFSYPSISSLRNLDIEANIIFDRVHRLNDAALLTQCYTQQALQPYIDSVINHIGHFIKV